MLKWLRAFTSNKLWGAVSVIAAPVAAVLFPENPVIAVLAATVPGAGTVIVEKLKDVLDGIIRLRAASAKGAAAVDLVDSLASMLKVSATEAREILERLEAHGRAPAG